MRAGIRRKVLPRRQTVVPRRVRQHNGGVVQLALLQERFAMTAARSSVSRRRALTTGGAIGLGAVWVAACGPGGTGGSGAAGSAGGDLSKRPPVNLEFWGDPPQTGSNARTDQIDAWNAKYPNLKVTFGTART